LRATVAYQAFPVIHRMSHTSSPAVAVHRIPVLDVGPYLAGEPGARDALADQIARTCEDTGFLVITNHRIDPALIDGAFAAAADFFDQDLERKLALKVGDLNIGYLPFGAQIVRTSKINNNTKPNLSESFYIVTDRTADDPEIVAGNPLFELNHWPPDMPAFKAATMAYFEAMRPLAYRMVSAIASALGLPGDYFAADFTDPTCTLRLIRIAWPRGAYPRRRMDPAAWHPWNLRGQHRRDADPVFERPLHRDAASGGQREQRPAPCDSFLLRARPGCGHQAGANLCRTGQPCAL
jgi:isopenicillin N synthase-like dioxygenase